VLLFCLILSGLLVYMGSIAGETKGRRAGTANLVTIKRLKNSAQTNYVPGQPVVYLIAVQNNGPDAATDVVIKDDAPANTTITGWTATVSGGAVTLPATSGTGNLNQTIAVLPNGAMVLYEVTVLPTTGMRNDLINTASISSSSTDPTPTCDACTAAVLPSSSRADIVTTKNLKDPAKISFAPGEVVEYVITVTNAGPSDAQNVVVRDIAPTGTFITGWTAAVTSGAVTLPATSGAGNLIQNISTLPNGAVLTYEVSVQTPGNYAGTLTNTVAVSSTTPDPRPVCTTCSVADLPQSALADVTVNKRLKDPSQVIFAPGDAVAYIITVTNNGPSNAADVHVVDVAPAGTIISGWKATVISGTVTLPATSGTGDLDQTIADLPNGAVVEYEVIVQTPSNFTGTLRNKVDVSTPTPDPTPDPGCPTCTSPVIPPSPSADIETVKTLKDSAQVKFAPGDTVVYKIVVVNHGPSDATSVNVHDAAPAGTTIVKWTASVTQGTFTLPATNGTGDLNQTIPLLPDGVELTYEVYVLTPSDYTGNLKNTVDVTSPTTDPNPDPGCPMCTTPDIPAAPIADIVAKKTLKDPTQVVFQPGDPVVYTITVTNDGPSDAADVNIKDDAPAGTTISGWTATVVKGNVTLPATSGTGNLNETIAVFPDGAVVVYEVTVQTPANFPGGPLKNVAVVTSNTPDPAPDCMDCSSTVPSVPTADVVAEKTLKDPSKTTFAAGEEVVYLITVKNNGPDTAKAVNIKDTAPAGTTITQWTATVTSGVVKLPNANGTGDLDETIDSLPVGAIVIYEVTVKTPPDFTGSLKNVAVVTSGTNDPDPTCPDCTAPDMPSGTSADIVVVKKLKDETQTMYTPGEAVVYTIVITNNGPSDAADVHVKDVAPEGAVTSGWTATVTRGTVTLPASSGTGDLDQTIPVLPYDAVVTYEVTMQTDADYTGRIRNIVAVTSSTPDPDASCDSCAAPVLLPGTRIPPIAIDDSTEVKEGHTVKVPILENDKPGDPVWGEIVPPTVIIVDAPLHGTVIVNNDGTIIYKPEPGYVGLDSLTYRVQDESGNWTNTATVKIDVQKNDIRIPNMITPNGDGANDKFVINGLEKYSQHELVIFNRWNNMLYRSNNYQGQWDGQGLNAGAYYYTLKVLDYEGKWHTINGYVMLMR